MLQFDEKLDDEDITLSWNATALLPVAATISTATVTVEVYEFSDGADPSPSGILSGSAQVNVSDVELDDGVVVGTAMAVLQKFTAGIAGVEYLTTWTATLSDGSKISEQGLLPVVSRFK